MHHHIDLAAGAADRATFVFSDIRQEGPNAPRWEYEVADHPRSLPDLTESCAAIWPALPEGIRAHLEAEGEDVDSFAANLAGQWRAFKSWSTRGRPLRVCITVLDGLPTLTPIKFLADGFDPLVPVDRGPEEPITVLESFTIPAADGTEYGATYHRNKHGHHVFTAIDPCGAGVVHTDIADKGRDLSPAEVQQRAAGAVMMASHAAERTCDWVHHFRDEDGELFRVQYHRAAHGAHAFTVTASRGAIASYIDFGHGDRELSPGEVRDLGRGFAAMSRAQGHRAEEAPVTALSERGAAFEKARA